MSETRDRYRVKSRGSRVEGQNGIAGQLRAWRDRHKLTQPEAAAKLGVPLPTYRKWEQGQRTPRGLAIDALLGKLNRTNR